VVARNVDTDLPHDIDGRGVQFSELSAPAEHLEAVPCMVPQEAFGHLAAAGILSTHKHDPRFNHWFASPSVSPSNKPFIVK
jgi:hypothetical protein